MIIASIAVILAMITIISVNVFNSPGPVTGFANTVTRPVRALASTVASIFENIYASINRYDDLMAEYEILTKTLAEYEQNYRQSAELAEENTRLRLLNDFRERHSGYAHEMATLQSWGSGNWFSSFTINKGYANSNVAKGYGVATEEGVLLGQVIEVSATTSIVITVLDTRFSAAAFVGGEGSGDSSGTATVKGDFSYMHNGLLIIDHIDDDISILPNAIVSTSGYGGVFPTGLVVGRVVNVYTHSNGIGRYATVKPLREIDTISEVFIITDFENPE